ncbi:MAG: PHP domain-containing protein [Candidatus Hodarchaeota archaeon]
MKIDLHTHSIYSMQYIPGLYWPYQDCTLTPELTCKLAKRRRLDGVALTDHDTNRGGPRFVKAAKKLGLCPLVGQEVSKYENGSRWAHIQVFGIDNLPWKIRLEPLEEFLDFVKDNNGIAILAHPFDLTNTVPSPGWDRELIQPLPQNLAPFKVIESHNGFQLKENNDIAAQISNKMGLMATGGSDAHYPEMVARCWTIFHDLPQDASSEDVLEVLRKGQREHVVAKGYGASFTLYLNWFISLADQYEWNIQKYLSDRSKKGTLNVEKSDFNGQNNPVFFGLHGKMPNYEKVFWLFVFRFLKPLWTRTAATILARVEKKTRKRYPTMIEQLNSRI